MPLRGRIKSWPWWLQANYLVVVVFMVFATALNGLGRMTQAGALLILVAGYRFFSYRVPRRNLPAIPRAVKYYLAWVVWCIVTGPWVAIYRPYLIQQLWVLVQVVVCMGACYILFSRQRQDSYMPYILLIIVAMNIVAIKMGYELIKEEGVRGIVQTQTEVGENRIGGLSGNANGLGFVFLNGIWALMALWRGGGFRAKWMRFLFKPIVVCGICLCGYYVFQTGSRKTLLTAVILCVGWVMWVVPGRLTAASFLVRVMLAILLVIIGAVGFGYVMRDTVVGARLWELVDSGGGSVIGGMQEDVRYQLVQRGLNLFWQHPLCGVGFMQYIIHVGLFAHADYIEVLADTGLIGFVLNQGFAVSAAIMLCKLLRRRLSSERAYKIRMYLLFIVCNHYLLCFGATFAGAHWHVIIMTFIALEAQKLWDENVRGKCLCGT